MNSTDHHQLIAGAAKGGSQLRLVLKRATHGQFHSVVELSSGTDSSSLTVLEQAENTGSESRDWPTSPPIQECLNHSAMENVLLTTGMAGKAHWSSAIEVKEPGPVAFIEWDVACRTATQPEFLGSVWQVANGASVTMEDDGVISVATAEKAARFTISATDGATLDIRQNDARTLVVISCTGDFDNLPGTFRWKYRIGIPPAH